MKTHETINWTTTRALVTGASRGLGLALARGIAARGGQVVLVARGQADLDSAVAGMVAAGGAAFGLVADVGAGGAAPSIAARATALLGGVDLLIHDASTLGPVPLRELADLDASALDAV
ncbi:MAG: NAD(P)-dependent dehydrogenase (short-subunit alcohol dehydrogenase family), partial [Myxococcota bacterium]